VDRKQYIKPEITKIVLDYTVSLQMQSGPIDPPPHGKGGGGGSKDDPFKSPFGDKPFG
jgi:hypothetical protein